MDAPIYSFLQAFWEILLESSPALILGFAIAGILHELIPTSLITRHLQKPGIGSVIKASAVGVPLPLCSCSVIPVAVSLRQRGASRGATASFFISTPEIGVDSFILSFSILGSLLAFARAIAAFLSAFVVGALIDQTEDPAPKTASEGTPASCCAHEEKPKRGSLIAALRFGFIDLVDDLVVLLLVGFALSALASVLLPADFFTSLGLSSTQMLFAALLFSLPIYVCATSSTPLAAVLMAKGLPVGAALVFLCAGPASNMATILAVKRELGTKALWIYLIGISTVTIAAGYLVDRIVELHPELWSMPEIGHGHIHESPLQSAAALLVVLAMVRALYSKWKAKRGNGAADCCSHSAAPSVEGAQKSHSCCGK